MGDANFEKIAERFAKLSAMIDNLEAVTNENRKTVEDLKKDDAIKQFSLHQFELDDLEEVTEDKEKTTKTTVRQDILKSAENCVCGHREEDYGSPEDNFSTIAKLWSVYLYGDDYVLSSSNVATMMILLKIARLRSGHGTKDCWVDIAGYAACGGEVDQFENLPNARFGGDV